VAKENTGRKAALTQTEKVERWAGLLLVLQILWLLCRVRDVRIGSGETGRYQDSGAREIMKLDRWEGRQADLLYHTSSAMEAQEVGSLCVCARAKVCDKKRPETKAEEPTLVVAWVKQAGPGLKVVVLCHDHAYPPNAA